MRPRTTIPQPLLAGARPELVQRHPVFAYFALTFAISWFGAFLVVAPQLMRHHSLSRMTGLLMFPVMLAGPALAGIFLTWLVNGTSGLRELFSRMRRLRFPTRWYATLLIPPVLVLTVLVCLAAFASPVFAPNMFFPGIGFGLVAGFFEEIGWMGYAFPKMCRGRSPLAASVLLGLLWGAWHLLVIDYLGASSPHGPYWPLFFLTFSAAMTGLRVLIGWTYVNTKSVLLAQMMHASSTGALVIFGPALVTSAQETLWYALYAGLLWMAAAAVVALSGKALARRPPGGAHLLH